MSLLEGTLAMAVIAGVTLTTLEMEQEVENQYQVYITAHQQNYTPEAIRALVFKPRGEQE
jgi:lipopolysaccharide export system protein LptC